MPWRSFWVYFVGGALIAASLSIATKTAVRWSGLLVGIMMFSFVAMIHLPGALARPHDRIIWTIVFREMSFGGAGWILADVTRGRVFVTATMLAFGVQHFLHPTVLPGVPLLKQMPTWIPGRAHRLRDRRRSSRRRRKRPARTANPNRRDLSRRLDPAAGPRHLRAGPDGALSRRRLRRRLEGLNYFADTLLFAGAILALANSS